MHPAPVLAFMYFPGFVFHNIRKKIEALGDKGYRRLQLSCEITVISGKITVWILDFNEFQGVKHGKGKSSNEFGLCY